jgi:orsellinic acid C2-O-methyltransferase
MSDEAIATIQTLIGGARDTQLVYVAAKLGIADALSAGPRNSDDLAAELGVNAPVLRRLLRGLANRGLVAEESAGIFALTETGQYLRARAPGGLRDSAIRTGEIQYPAWGSLLYAVETGQPAFEHAHGIDLFSYLAARPIENDSFNEGMRARAEALVDEIVAGYDFSRFTRVVDVGGGVGVLLSRVLAANPDATGILYDSPAVTAKASAYLTGRGLAGRAEVMAGDFFAAVPGGDLLMLSAILHDWDDERAAAILRQCRQALESGGRILIIEDLLPDSVGQGRPEIESDLTMLVCHGGQERTLAEFEDLLAREGLRLESVSEAGPFGHLITAST